MRRRMSIIFAFGMFTASLMITSCGGNTSNNSTNTNNIQNVYTPPNVSIFETDSDGYKFYKKYGDLTGSMNSIKQNIQDRQGRLSYNPDMDMKTALQISVAAYEELVEIEPNVVTTLSDMGMQTTKIYVETYWENCTIIYNAIKDGTITEDSESISEELSDAISNMVEASNNMGKDFTSY